MDFDSFYIVSLGIKMENARRKEEIDRGFDILIYQIMAKCLHIIKVIHFVLFLYFESIS